VIDDGMQEQAAAYALGALDAAELPAFETALRADPELRALVRELRAVSEALAGMAPAIEPSPALKERLLRAIEQPLADAPARRSTPAWIPWGLAAALALVSIGALWRSAELSAQLEAQATRIHELTVGAELARSETSELRLAVEKLRESNRVANFRIALLDSLLAASPKTLAVSVWDNERQDGVFIVRNLKPLPGDKDYQLWIIDPKYPSPVDAGVFQVDAQGNGREDFRAKLPIQAAKQFAVTIERKGGSDVPNTKAIVLAGS
jgi:anti-sigma-K factor RskA